jgi:hypothetical protein
MNKAKKREKAQLVKKAILECLEQPCDETTETPTYVTEIARVVSQRLGTSTNPMSVARHIEEVLHEIRRSLADTFTRAYESAENSPSADELRIICEAIGNDG